MASAFHYDYTQTMWLKFFLARPDSQNNYNSSEVSITYEQALELVKAIDNITQGIPKIVYLVGWQGMGHDDCFPEMNVVNDALKRDCDATGRESLLWLIEEAKAYHTVISYHACLSDAYPSWPSFRELEQVNALVNDADGKPAIIEYYNSRPVYKISFKQFWESGLFQKYFDGFCETVPVCEAKTVHLDNFCISESMNPRTTLEEQDEARNKILDYIISKGIDVTSEYTYREAPLRGEDVNHPLRKMYAESVQPLPVCHWQNMPFRTLGRIPATWWTSNMTAQDCIDIPPSLYSGHLNNQALANVFYGAMHGEDIWMEHGNDPEKWFPYFLHEFCTYQLPYFYLNRFQRLSFEENPDVEPALRFTAYFSNDVVSRGLDKSITRGGVVLKQQDDVILPLTEDNRTFIAYSASGRSGKWNVPDAAFDKADVYKISAAGNCLIGQVSVCNGQIELALEAGQAVAIKAAE